MIYGCRIKESLTIKRRDLHFLPLCRAAILFYNSVIYDFGFGAQLFMSMEKTSMSERGDL